MSPNPIIHFSTILSSTPSGLVKRIASLSTKYGNRGHTVLFALSANFPRSEDLQAVVERLTSFNSVSDGVKSETLGHTLGCLTDSFAGVSFQKTDVASHALSCSIGIFDSTQCTPYRSELSGRIQPQVGRWHAFRKKDDSGIDGMDEAGRLDWERMKDSADGEVNWENIWNASASSSTDLTTLLPDALQKLEPAKIQALVSLSSAHPDTLTRVLTDYISVNSRATVLTLVAAPTHFVTGRAVTLFMDGQIFGEGAVGLAFLDGKAKCSFRTEFVGMKRISVPMTVTSREGNMINALDNSNPTRLLLSALDQAGIGAAKNASSSPFAATFKDDEQFALALLSPDGEILETYKITAGDPSSRGGSLSLDAPRAPEIGSSVQFLHCPTNTRVRMPLSLQQTPTETKTLAFFTVPELETDTDARPSDIHHEESVFEDTFMAPSTHGFIVSKAAINTLTKSTPSESWSCSLSGGIAAFKWRA